mmetsp:Transcript_13743/g.42936  ORF Transcript_13743/g.42936 Transcript_13743/m.42936 type:complete len:310 (-) Transcript_13743:513-1442(-)
MEMLLSKKGLGPSGGCRAAPEGRPGGRPSPPEAVGCTLSAAGTPAAAPMRSTIVAFAVPPLSHIVSSPYRPPRRSSSPMRLDMSMAPVAPMGCPRAIAPPFTFTLERSPPVQAFAQASGTEEKASFTSTRSMSLMARPALPRTCSVAGTGPSSITTGSRAARPSATTRALGRRPSRCRPRSLQTSRAAAPSQICEAAAAVSTPFARMGLSLARASRFVSGRMPSSVVCSSSGARALEMPSRLRHGRGTISEKRPARAASAARAWLRAAKASASSRVTPHRLATSSAPTNWSNFTGSTPNVAYSACMREP